MNRPPKLFVGMGNVLCRDDGIGVRAAAELAHRSLPRDIEVYDAGTVGLDAASVLELRKLIVIADAIDAGAAPGTIFRLSPEELRLKQISGLSLHDLNLLDALAETRMMGRAPERVVALCVQVADTSPGMELSPQVSRALPRLVRLALRELEMRSDPIGRLSAGRPQRFALSEG
jgi:hydrogenase maturation protease